MTREDEQVRTSGCVQEQVKSRKSACTSSEGPDRELASRVDDYVTDMD